MRITYKTLSVSLFLSLSINVKPALADVYFYCRNFDQSEKLVMISDVMKAPGTHIEEWQASMDFTEAADRDPKREFRSVSGRADCVDSTNPKYVIEAFNRDSQTPGTKIFKNWVSNRVPAEPYNGSAPPIPAATKPEQTSSTPSVPRPTSTPVKRDNCGLPEGHPLYKPDGWKGSICPQ